MARPQLNPPDGMFKATTGNVTVRVWTAFDAEYSNPAREIFSFRYTIEVENGRTEPVQLVARHWRIVDATGRAQMVDGPGVVGEQPTIAAGESFHYQSGVQLRTPTGSMRGHFDMQAADGDMLEARIPGFPLKAPVLN